MINQLMPVIAPLISKSLTKREFVYAVFEEAKIEELRSGVPAAVTTAQAILESGYGKKIPTDIDNGTYSYNLFGIKAHGNSRHVSIWTHEEVNGHRIRIRDRFMAYGSYRESIQDRTDFFRRNRRYAELFTNSNPEWWAVKLQEKGYATDGAYADKLISIMHSWNLI